jgi:hypothetical protein
MAEFKVRDLGEVESKSVQEVEKALLEKHEQQMNQEGVPVEKQELSIKDEDVLSHIKNRYGKEINSLDDSLPRGRHPLNYQRMSRLSSNTRKRLGVAWTTS